MSDDEHESEYRLLMPFVVVQSVGGPYDDASYVAGWNLGYLDARLQFSPRQPVEVTINTSNRPQVDLVAMKHGYTLDTEPLGRGDYLAATLTPAPVTLDDAGR